MGDPRSKGAMADVMTQNVCGRVIAMLSHKEDAPPEALADLVRAVNVDETPPLVISKPVLPVSACVALIVAGVALALMLVHLVRDEDDDC
jgi:hypothetical protein